MRSGGLEVRHAGGSVRVPAGRPFVIGRGPHADLDLPHPRVSRRHAVVELTAGGWTLTDSSSNGTYLLQLDRVPGEVLAARSAGRGSGTPRSCPPSSGTWRS
jgi:pSer/pThr/pTyr-binding forkhead associated (FHA) protein